MSFGNNVFWHRSTNKRHQKTIVSRSEVLWTSLSRVVWGQQVKIVWCGNVRSLNAQGPCHPKISRLVLLVWDLGHWRSPPNGRSGIDQECFNPEDESLRVSESNLKASIKICKNHWGFHRFFKIGVPKNDDVPMMFPLENMEKKIKIGWSWSPAFKERCLRGTSPLFVFDSDMYPYVSTPKVQPLPFSNPT